MSRLAAVVIAAFGCTHGWAQKQEEHKIDSVPAATQATPRNAGVKPSSVADTIAQRTNAFRGREGRDAVTWNRELGAAAQDFAEFMARTGRYGHEADGRQPSERAVQHGYAYCVVAENIAYRYRSAGFGSDQLAKALVDGWEHSPPHRRNMLDRDVIDIGVGVAQSTTSDRWYGVQMFGLPQSANIAFRVTNDAAVGVRYRLGKETFDLLPRVTRSHEQCRPPRLTFSWPTKQPTATVEPHGGDHYVVSRSASGAWRLEQQ
ncbi:MAG: CAP domain-containing protein [Pseudomonadota bacterium]|nr:CAP domain-containing protein [Pseudomonadota bacterium]